MTKRPGGIPAADLEDEDLKRELHHLYETREETFFHGSGDAFEIHTERMLELEQEYALRRPQDTKADPARTRTGSRAIAHQPLDE
jgi:uncharacterized protein DUF6158